MIQVLMLKVKNHGRTLPEISLWECRLAVMNGRTASDSNLVEI